MKPYSPKGRVANIVKIACPEAHVEVNGARVKGKYFTEVSVNNVIVARGSDRDWRKAYKVLEIELSKRFVA